MGYNLSILRRRQQWGVPLLRRRKAVGCTLSQGKAAAAYPSSGEGGATAMVELSWIWCLPNPKLLSDPGSPILSMHTFSKLTAQRDREAGCGPHSKPWRLELSQEVGGPVLLVACYLSCALGPQLTACLPTSSDTDGSRSPSLSDCWGHRSCLIAGITGLLWHRLWISVALRLPLASAVSPRNRERRQAGASFTTFGSGFKSLLCLLVS